MSLHLVLDTVIRQNNQGTHGDYVFHFDKLNIEGFSKIKLKSVYIQHENDTFRLFKEQHDNDASRTIRPIYVHCSLLNKDHNWLNGKKSDVLAVLYPPTNILQPTHHSKNLLMKFDSAPQKQLLPCSYMRLQVRNCNGELLESKGKFYIVYEIEFLP